MSCLDKIHYTVFKTAEDDFISMAGSLIGGFKLEGHILRVVVFGRPDGNVQYSERRSILKELVRKRFGDHVPVVSYVAQPSLDCGLQMEVHYCGHSEGVKVSYKTFDGSPYVTVEDADGYYLFAGGLQSDLDKDVYSQARDVFRRMKGVLDEEGFAVDEVVRQWNYIERITEFHEGQQHYQMFNNARSEFYSQVKWKDGYPAATGIGTDCGGVLVDFDAVRFSSPSCSVLPVDNDLQVAAHEYSEKVLKEAVSGRTTPKFERAKALDHDRGRLVYISGTAAIRGEGSLGDADVERQYEVTMENIARLTGGAELEILRVYLKDAADYPRIADKVNREYGNCAVSFMRSDVCREELLIEIEGVAFDVKE